MAAGATVADLKVAISADTSQATAAINGLSGLLSRGPLLLGVGILTVAVAGIGVASLKMAGDFQSSLETLVTGANESQSNLGMISRGILQMAQATGTSTTDLVSGLYLIESAGYHGAAGLQILQAAAEGAKVGNADLATVADAVTTVLTDYNLKASDANMVTNLLITTVGQGKTHMQDLAAAMSTVLPAAAAMHIPLNDVMAAMATMTNQGTDAASAATYLRQTLLMLEAPSSAATKALNDAGLTTQEVATEMQKSLPGALQMITNAVGKEFPVGSAAYVAAMKDIVGGTRSMQGILELTSAKGAKEFSSILGTINTKVKDGGNTINGWNHVQSTFNFQMDRAGSSLQVVMIQLGQHLLPVATQVAKVFADNFVPAIQGLVQWVTQAVAWVQKFQPILIGVAVSIAGFLVNAFVMWAASAAAAAVATIAATWPILAIGAAIALLVAGVIWAYQNWGWFRDAVTAVKNVLGDIMGFIGAHVIPALGSLAGTIGNAVGTSFKVLGQDIQAVKNFFQQIIDIVNKVISVFVNLGKSIGSAMKTAGNAASGIGGVLGNLIPHFASGGIATKPMIAMIGENESEAIVPLSQLGNAAGAIKGLPSNFGGAMAGLGSSGGNAAQQLQSTFVIQLDGKQIAQSTIRHAPGLIRLATGARAF